MTATTTQPTTAAEAREAGYTRRIVFECMTHSLDLLVRPDTDLDDRFVAYCMDAHELLRVNGWTGIIIDDNAICDAVNSEVLDDTTIDDSELIELGDDATDLDRIYELESQVAELTSQRDAYARTLREIAAVGKVNTIELAKKHRDEVSTGFAAAAGIAEARLNSVVANADITLDVWGN